MSYEEAYNYLDTIAAQYKGTRQDHQALVQALTVVRDLINYKAQEEAGAYSVNTQVVED